ncbi:pectate lyase family protein [Glycomyces buryatensis]|uniref:Pectate lyase domain-containing protein n=1 Tax=Glycomyces buryatensis TaxID=2570927 RepID=A0A4S8QDY5_9ACTN|nr:right-handed parallel beta-helix repeat-containing protein [Glycomyces buryatensis]THV42783.1 hypothetical protein FAB82_04490 [Glycomyces buryatensis]
MEPTSDNSFNGPRTSRRRLAKLGGVALAGIALPTGVVAALNPASASTEESAGGTALGAAQSDSPIGYAAQNGGTTGGYGGATVNEVTLSEAGGAGALQDLLDAHQDTPDDGLVVHIDQTIGAGDFEKLDVKDVSNVSLLGVGTSGVFNGVGINLSWATNIVIRNLTIHHVAEGEGDGIGIQSASSNVWIDHNEIYNDYPDVDKDFYDGLIDVKGESQYITVSWNYLHDSWKTMLTASSDSEGANGDYITYANNFFDNVNSRVPLIRRSHVHFLNNYLLDVVETAVNCRMGAEVLVEGNFFENVGDGEADETTGDIHGPVGWWYGSDEPGFWNLVDNVYENSPSDHLTSTGSFTVDYDYTALTPDEAKAQVSAGAGVGQI